MRFRHSQTQELQGGANHNKPFRRILNTASTHKAKPALVMISWVAPISLSIAIPRKENICIPLVTAPTPENSSTKSNVLLPASEAAAARSSGNSRRNVPIAYAEVRGGRLGRALRRVLENRCGLSRFMHCRRAPALMVTHASLLLSPLSPVTYDLLWRSHSVSTLRSPPSRSTRLWSLSCSRVP